MVTDLSALFAADGVLPFGFSLDLSDVCFSGVYPIKNADISGEIISHASVVEMSGKASFIYSRPCDRCAEPVEKNMVVSFSHTLVTSCTDEKNTELIVVEGMKLDLGEVVREDILLSLPGRYLCKKDCKGLCVQCGKNLNEGNCSCKDREPDPRFAALKELLD